jgi:hypothetical protein
MSQSLLDLIKAYGDARTDWATDRINCVPEALDEIEARLNRIRELLVTFKHDDPDRESQIFMLMKLLDRDNA